MKIYKITWGIGNIVGLWPYTINYYNFDAIYILSIVLSTLILLFSVLEGLSTKENVTNYAMLFCIGVFTSFSPFIFSFYLQIIPTYIYFICGFVVFTLSLRKYLLVLAKQREFYLKDI